MLVSMDESPSSSGSDGLSGSLSSVRVVLAWLLIAASAALLAVEEHVERAIDLAR